jgi:outer membrane protein assembly factor BamB
MPWLRSLVALVLCGTIATAGDWPQWLGPTRDGVSPETVAPWKEPPRVIWRHSVAEGNSSPVVAAGRVFLHSKIKDQDEEEVLALDTRGGKELWRKTYPRAAFKSLYGNGPRATPAVVGDRVYTFGITGILTCWEAASGTRRWQVDTFKEFGARNLFFGVACSPLVEGGRILVNVGGRGASIVALDAERGEVAWKALDDRASYASPIVFEQGGQRQVVFLTQQGLVSLRPADGHLYWRFPFVDKLLESSSTPVRVGDYLLASAITIGSAGLRLGTKEGKPDVREVWKNEALTSYFTTPIPVGREHVYLVSATKPPALVNTAQLHCIEVRTGQDLWQKPRRVGKYHATLLRTGDEKLLMLEEAGDLVLVDPDPKGYRELARSKVCGETWAHPALADGRLYVRDDKEIVCLELKER